ncbi:hypothetical protein GCM10007301_54150 [Azorhizobium oxalatiphilum]|uniref:Uncharacterized protein n=1 Tax=Azorhizobium oxalatiphilum TaxID=980631 RepID=A0A917CG33_9HYPH|nr:hypothetical protein [Azorhizobium oxalatiphilum]GGF87436.1 hypothetical protein GCM10007301_54150 [Azorhizobium oxalatiphilum]
MSNLSLVPAGASYRLVVEAMPDPNVLLRLLEPFVIHDVLPHRIDVAHCDNSLAVELEITASPDLAARLEGRLRAMVPVSDVAMVCLGEGHPHGSAALTVAA